MNATNEKSLIAPCAKTPLRPNFLSTEDENGATLRIALPGVRKEDLTLTLRETNLKIEANRTDPDGEGWKSHRDTGCGGRYELTVQLTRRFDGSQAKAALADGVLTLEVPIREEAKPRQITVN